MMMVESTGTMNGRALPDLLAAICIPVGSRHQAARE
jgi:hypothetical protein